MNFSFRDPNPKAPFRQKSKEKFSNRIFRRWLNNNNELPSLKHTSIGGTDRLNATFLSPSLSALSGDGGNPFWQSNHEEVWKLGRFARLFAFSQSHLSPFSLIRLSFVTGFPLLCVLEFQEVNKLSQASRKMLPSTSISMLESGGNFFPMFSRLFVKKKMDRFVGAGRDLNTGRWN